MHKTMRRSLTRLVLVGTLSAVAVTGCAGREQKREYAAPQEVCGTPVPASLLEPFLPVGKQVRVGLAETGGIGLRRCNVSVDGKRALSLATEWAGPGTDIAQMYPSWPGIDVRKHVARDGSHSYSEEGGVSKISCPRPDKAWRSQPGQLFAVVFALHTGPENEQAMQRLTAEYARAVGRSAQCNAKGAVQAG